MKTIRFNIIMAFVLALLCTATIGKAQSTFKQGDVYSKTTRIHASGVLQRGNQQFNINTASSISKTYKVTGLTGNGVILTVTTTHIADTVDAFNKRQVYDSAKPADTSSFIQMALQSLVGKVVTLSIDRSGIITDVNDPDEQYATDTLMTFAGFNRDQFITGSRLDLFADYQPAKKSGETWVSHTALDDEKISTTYTVGESAEEGRHVSLSVNSTSTGTDQNSYTNGVLVVDQGSGVILLGAMKTATVSYKLVNNTASSFSRRTEVLEKCTKMN
ncbi:DUF6263 family protein [Mucilaginibacter celer]|uniref:Uncharacterized protein n=1 Tax=Mucilaginibacter celer TaxID=2305508 RepID=A0A494VZB6_9SPHI|nr:DUF6263 family protein [Mucilaginibacter celer]AYL98830.1 hypothetical protein HYN43_027735 [Mucilaginibacter celer]